MSIDLPVCARSQTVRCALAEIFHVASTSLVVDWEFLRCVVFRLLTGFQVPRRVQNMLPMMLAALFHHYDWVTTNVAQQHPIFTSRAVKLITRHGHLLRLDPDWLDDHNKSAGGMSVRGHALPWKPVAPAVTLKRRLKLPQRTVA